MSDIYPCGFALLKPVVQHYHWGEPSPNSFVYKLYQNFLPESSVSSNSDDRYAELWLGTHPKGPSTLISNDMDEPLSAHLKRIHSSSPRDFKESEYLGFLLKVLSIEKPLSIQIHPDSSISSQLFAAGHQSISDNRGKTEVCIALTQFEALYSLKTLSQIISEANSIGEFKILLENDGLNHVLNSNDFSNESECYNKIISIIKCILNSDNSVLKQLTSRLEHATKLNETETILLKLHKMYPNDSGIWFGLVMNYIKMEPGQALFVPPNTIHAYISGNCIECMTSSDNVIRGGLTKKHKDKSIILQCLNSALNPHILDVLTPSPLYDNNFVMVYKPVHDLCNFSVTRICLPPGKKLQYTPSSNKKCAIGIIIAHNKSVKFETSPINPPVDTFVNDDNVEIKRGTSMLIYPNTLLKIENCYTCDAELGNMPESFVLPEASPWFVMFIAHTDDHTSVN